MDFIERMISKISNLINPSKKKMLTPSYYNNTNKTWKEATGLDVPEVGIDPCYFKRDALGGCSPVEILAESKGNKKTLKEIYDVYGDQIVFEYLNDLEVRNPSLVKIKERVTYLGARGGLQDHVKTYTEDELHSIFKKYFNNEELTDEEKCIVVGLIVKETDLIGLYSLRYLKSKPEYIKAEIESGVFSDIISGNKKYTNYERKKIAELSKVWDRSTIEEYNNLALLQKRLQKLKASPEIKAKIDRISEILDMNYGDIQENASEIKDFIKEVYSDYEIQNRAELIEQVYDPGEAKEIIITDLAQMTSAPMLHFFNLDEKIASFDYFLKNREEKLGRKITEEERYHLLDEYESKENRLIPNYVIDDFNGIGQIENYGIKYYTNTANQLSTMIVNPEEMLLFVGQKGYFALGFSKKTLEPEQIAISCTNNAHSNKGLHNIESNNQFRDFSATYEEIVNNDERILGNSEIVLFRNTLESTIKPSYVLYVGTKELSTLFEKKNLERIRTEMKELGLDVPLVIFDRYTIMEKRKAKRIEEEKTNKIEREQ